MTSTELMRMYLRECALHDMILSEGLSEAGKWMPLSTDTLVGKEMLRVFDQIAYRFGKLQDSMGGKVMPLILDMAQETVSENATLEDAVAHVVGTYSIPPRASQ